MAGGPCPDDVTWYQPGSDACVRHYDSYYTISDLCGDCDDATKTPPSAPTGVPEDCCSSNCCKTVWSSTYTCGTSTWSTPVISTASVPNVACASDSGWIDTGTSCVSHYTKYTTPADCTSGVTAPSAHGAGAPACCCPEPPCTSCGLGTSGSGSNPQPSCVVTGFIGSCASRNGTYTPTTYSASPFLSGFLCVWSWTGAGGVIQLQYNTNGGGSWVCVAFGAGSPVFISCICGDLRGTVAITCPTGGLGFLTF